MNLDRLRLLFLCTTGQLSSETREDSSAVGHMYIVYVCVCVSIYVYICVYIYIYIYMYTCIANVIHIEREILDMRINNIIYEAALLLDADAKSRMK